jgi:hypothetical protein
MRPAFQPATWLLQLPAEARRLMTAFIAIGVAFAVGYIVIIVVLISTANVNTSTPVGTSGLPAALASGGPGATGDGTGGAAGAASAGSTLSSAYTKLGTR